MVNGKEAESVLAETITAAIFAVSESFDIGKNNGSGVVLEYHDKVTSKFNGKIEKTNI